MWVRYSAATAVALARALVILGSDAGIDLLHMPDGVGVFVGKPCRLIGAKLAGLPSVAHARLGEVNDCRRCVRSSCALDEDQKGFHLRFLLLERW